MTLNLNPDPTVAAAHTDMQHTCSENEVGSNDLVKAGCNPLIL